MTAERAIRWSAVAAVAVLAGVAGWVSYLHAWELVRTHGETGAVGQVYPATVDGMVYVSSMVLLAAARRRADAPALAYWVLGAGILATLYANVSAGLAYGVAGAVIAAWPALALIGSYELLMWLARGETGAQAQRPAADRTGPPADVPLPRRTPTLERRPAKVRAEILRALADGQSYRSLAKQHKVTPSGMSAFARRHAAEVEALRSQTPAAAA